MNEISGLTSSLPLPSVSLPGMETIGRELATGEPQDAAQIKKVAEDFESIFMSLLLKEMRSTISSEEQGGLFAGEGSDTYGGLFDMFIGQHLASANQLGIGKAIEAYLQNKLS